MWKLVLFFILSGCAGVVNLPNDMTYREITHDKYTIATWARISDDTAPVHVYIEGDGHAFSYNGQPTDDPTPRAHTVRDWVINDAAPNVMYVARPCQYVMTDACNVADWTSGRFSTGAINATANAIKSVAQNRPVILIGYSGGALMSGLVIQNNTDLSVKKWITVAGVLNHTDWTSFWGDSPLKTSQDLNTLPHICQSHYMVIDDKIVPNSHTRKFAPTATIVPIKNATHSEIKDIEFDFEC